MLLFVFKLNFTFNIFLRKKLSEKFNNPVIFMTNENNLQYNILNNEKYKSSKAITLN